MPRTTFTAAAPDGQLDATLHTPDGDGPWPGVVVFPDAGGARDSIHAIAERIAGMGYAAVVPNVYYREGAYPPFQLATAFTDAGERKRMFSMMGKLTNDAVVADAGALLDAMDERPEVAPGRVGTTGYCMGGRISLLVAGSLPDRIGAAASFHGGRVAVDGDPSSPHLLADRIEAEVLVAGAHEDGSFTAEQSDLLEQALTQAGVRHVVETWPAHHGFAVADNPTYDPAAEERHFQALQQLYARTLAS